MSGAERTDDEGLGSDGEGWGGRGGGDAVLARYSCIQTMVTCMAQVLNASAAEPELHGAAADTHLYTGCITSNCHTHKPDKSA